MTKKTAAKGHEQARQANQGARRAEPNLDSRYGEIGISAVAAALQYQSEVKNPAYAPAVHKLEKWAAEMAVA
jgi:hypothetical protein